MENVLDTIICGNTGRFLPIWQIMHYPNLFLYWLIIMILVLLHLHLNQLTNILIKIYLTIHNCDNNCNKTPTYTNFIQCSAYQKLPIPNTQILQLFYFPLPPLD